ncbi:MAG: hypothetical protein U0103_16650 [Candidatus Obscuribacterales bacterium]
MLTSEILLTSGIVLFCCFVFGCVGQLLVSFLMRANRRATALTIVLAYAVLIGFVGAALGPETGFWASFATACGLILTRRIFRDVLIVFVVFPRSEKAETDQLELPLGS